MPSYYSGIYIKMGLLAVSDVYKKQQETSVVKGVSFELQRAQRLAIAGETGSGKSTLLKIIAGLVQADSGNVYFEEKRIKGPLEVMMIGHPRIAYLSQHFELRNNYRVEELLEMANKLTPESAAYVYEICRITHLLKRRTDQLSGGEKQRIAMARLLVTAPRLFLLDEPFSNLDMLHKETLKSVINDIGEQLDVTCILVSHDPLDLLSWAENIIVMRDGQIVQQDSASRIYFQPVNEYVAGIFGKYNLLPAGFPGITPQEGMQAFIRPEHVAIATGSEPAVSGIVRKYTFFGSYAEVEVTVMEKVMTMRMGVSELKAGDEVRVMVKGEKVWYM